MIFLDDLSHWFISVNQRNFEKQCPFLLCRSVYWMRGFALYFTPAIPYLTIAVTARGLQYSLINRYSTFGWLNCVGRDTWGKNSACYQWVGPWLCNVQNWLRVSLLCLILSFLASKTVSIIVCWHFLCLIKLCGERHLREKLCMVSVEWIV